MSTLRNSKTTRSKKNGKLIKMAILHMKWFGYGYERKTSKEKLNLFKKKKQCHKDQLYQSDNL